MPLNKAATKIAYVAILQSNRAASLEKVSKAVTQRKQRKKKIIQK